MVHRITRRVSPINCAAAAMLASTMLICSTYAAPGAPAVVLTNPSGGWCGPTRSCPADPAPDAPMGGDQATAERQIIDGYVTKQIGCTPDLTPHPQAVNWNPPGFTAYVGGSGNIVDDDSRLGGQFTADYVNGRWHIAYLYC
ncbi:hypothetical protein MB901379_04359 [Mycobacterium basiliense]|uniref:Integrase n=1 Tax=Mycobacterium basiliense TaxID=2094119 RepID=A0A3S4BLC7_9MYCO|nr:integrase [Mycobacterium basiliense]VDM90750.1 hypothetical protein MB901379_04359 [Mycobacterium basiliense]